MFYKKAALKNFAIIHREHLCWRLEGLQLSLKETSTQVLFCDYCEIFKTTFFEKDLRTAAFLLFQWFTLT